MILETIFIATIITLLFSESFIIIFVALLAFFLWEEYDR